MSNLRKHPVITSLLALSLIGFSIGLYILKFYNCEASVFCYFLIIKGQALFYGMGSLSIIFFTLLIFPHTINAWKKFALFFIPLALFFFIGFLQSTGGGFFSVSPEPEQVFKLLSGLYVLISLIIIAWSVFKDKKQGQLNK